MLGFILVLLSAALFYVYCDSRKSLQIHVSLDRTIEYFLIL